MEYRMVIVLNYKFIKLRSPFWSNHLFPRSALNFFMSSNAGATSLPFIWKILKCCRTETTLLEFSRLAPRFPYFTGFLFNVLNVRWCDTFCCVKNNIMRGGWWHTPYVLILLSWNWNFERWRTSWKWSADDILSIVMLLIYIYYGLRVVSKNW